MAKSEIDKIVDAVQSLESGVVDVLEALNVRLANIELLLGKIEINTGN